MRDFPEFISCTDPGASESEIKNIEEFLGYRLPDDYSDTLKYCNAPHIESLDKVVHCQWLNTDLTPARDDEANEFEVINPIFTLWKTESIIKELMQIHEYSDNTKLFIPKFYLPFSHDSGGADYVINVSDDDHRGSIYVWYVNINEPWGEGGNRYLGYVADSFTQFIYEKIVDAPEDW